MPTHRKRLLCKLQQEDEHGHMDRSSYGSALYCLLFLKRMNPG